MDIFKTFATDEKREIEGVWHEINKGSKIKVARRSNSKYQALISTLYERNKRLLDKKGEVARAKSLELTIEAMAKHLLVGWEGIEHEGAPLEYSFDNAKLLLSVKDFRELVGELSDQTELFKVTSEEEQLGN